MPAAGQKISLLRALGFTGMGCGTRTGGRAGIGRGTGAGRSGGAGRGATIVGVGVDARYCVIST